MHIDRGFPVIIGHDNVIGHGVIIHGATIGNHNLVGMRATVMNGVRIGNYCIIGSHALLTEGMEIPDYSLVLGIPAKIKGKVTPEMLERASGGVQHYLDEAKNYLNAAR